MIKKIHTLILVIAGFAHIIVVGDDIEVNVPDVHRVKLTESEKERNSIYRKLAIYLPYSHSEGYKIFTTLGKLVKLSDAAVIGHVTSVERPDKNRDMQNLSAKFNINLNVETHLFGSEVKTNIPLSIVFTDLSIELEKNDRLLVFLAKEDFSHNPMKIYKWNFDKEKLTGKKKNDFFVAGYGRGCIKLSQTEESEELIKAVKNYQDILCQKEPNIDLYYNLLRNLVLSENSRIRKDAISDLLVLIGTSTQTAFDVKRVLADDNIDDGIKKYLRLYWIPYVEEYRKNL